MGIDMTSPRQAAETYLMGDTCELLRPRLIDNGRGGTKPDPSGPLRIGPFICGFSAANGTEQNVADQMAQRGSYRLKLQIELRDPDSGDPITLAETDQFEVFGRVYNVKWLPPVAALSLSRKVGLEEA